MKTLEQKIMSRVKRIYYLRMLTGTNAMRAYALIVLGAVLASLVSLVNVVANMPSLASPASVARFLADAALHTETAVQVVLVGFFSLVAWMARDFLWYVV
jgi:hypothetical protein